MKIQTDSVSRLKGADILFFHQTRGISNLPLKSHPPLELQCAPFWPSANGRPGSNPIRFGRVGDGAHKKRKELDGKCSARQVERNEILQGRVIVTVGKVFHYGRNQRGRVTMTGTRAAAFGLNERRCVSARVFGRAAPPYQRHLSDRINGSECVRFC